MVAHACNPSTLEAKVGRLPEVGSSRPPWPTWWNTVFKKKKIASRQNFKSGLGHAAKNLPGMVAHACNPSTLEAKVGQPPEVGSSRPAG